MRKWLCVPMMTLCVLLAGCGAVDKATGKTDLRQAYQLMEGCVMEAVITGGAEEVTAFTLRCEYVPNAASTVEILAPETAVGIRAVVDGSESITAEDLDVLTAAAQHNPWILIFSKKDFVNVSVA